MQLPSQITREVVGRRRELRLLLGSRERGEDPGGHIPGLRLALHVIEHEREEARAIEDEHVPGRVYGREDTIIEDEEGRIAEIVTEEGTSIVTDRFIWAGDVEPLDADSNSVHDASADDRPPPRYHER